MTVAQSGAGRSAFSSVAALAMRWPLATLSLLCLLAWLPGFFSLPPLDRDESRFAQASKQMIETGNYIDIRYNSGPRYNKPVGIYWLQAASTRLFGRPPYDAIWTYRVPSLLGALIAVFLAYWCMRALAPPPIAMMAAALIGFTVSLTAETKIAKTDAVLLAAILGSQGLLLRAYLAARLSDTPPNIWVALGGWFALAVGILVKGPLILAVLGVTVVAVSLWDRDWVWLRGIHWLPGIVLTALVVLPWFIAIAYASHGAFYEQALGHDFAQKVMGGQESHGAPPGYYLLLASLTLWPATLFALPGIGSAIARRKEPALRYLIAWLGAAWLMFEIAPTKLPHYILPAYPAIAFMAALWAMRDADPVEPRWARILRYVAAAQFLAGVAALTLAPVYALRRFGSGVDPVIVAGLTAGALAGLVAAILLLTRRTIFAAFSAGLAALLFYAVILCAVAPRLDQIWISPRAAAMVAKDRFPDDPPVVLAGYVEPSLTFLLGTDTQIGTGKTAAVIAAQQGGLALVEDGQRKQFLTRIGELAAIAKPVDEMRGYSYSHGAPQHLTLYRVTPAAQITEPPA